MRNARRQIWEVRVPRDVELTSLENRNEQEQNKNVEKGTKRKIENQRKNEWEEEEEMNEGTTKNDLSCNDKNDPWSDHPKTQFGPIYPFFRNHKP